MSHNKKSLYTLNFYKKNQLIIRYNHITTLANYDDHKGNQPLLYAFKKACEDLEVRSFGNHTAYFIVCNRDTCIVIFLIFFLLNL